jgi:hypothetical protein
MMLCLQPWVLCGLANAHMALATIIIIMSATMVNGKSKRLFFYFHLLFV